MMRVTEAMTYRLAVSSMQARQSEIATTQQALSSGNKFSQAAQDPTDAAQVLNLDAQLSNLTARGTTLGIAQLSLQTESQALTDAQGILQQARTLALQANSGTQDATSRESIAQQIDSLRTQLMTVANRSDANGKPLFGGDTASGPVFTTNASGQVQYSGGDQPTWLQVDASAAMPSGDSGRDVFMMSPSGGNGLQVNAGSANQGGLLLQGVTPSTTTTAPAFTLSFSTGTYTATAPDGTVLASGAYGAGQSLTVQGMTLSLSGTPSDGDTLTVRPAVNQDIFSTLSALSAAVRTGNATQRANAIFATNDAVDAASAHLTELATRNGGRLNALTALQQAQGTQTTQVQAVRSTAGDVDYAQAASQLSLLTTALQAAQQSFAKIQSLSLFQYIK